jgi:hypothetical protein
VVGAEDGAAVGVNVGAYDAQDTAESTTSHEVSKPASHSVHCHVKTIPLTATDPVAAKLIDPTELMVNEPLETRFELLAVVLAVAS